GVLRREPDRLVEVCERALVVSFPQPSITAILVRAEGASIQLDRPVVIGDGSLEFSFGAQGHPAQLVSRSKGGRRGINLDGFIEFHNGTIKFVLFEPCDAAVPVGKGILRVPVDRLVKVSDRAVVFMLAQPDKRSPIEDVGDANAVSRLEKPRTGLDACIEIIALKAKIYVVLSVGRGRPSADSK